MPRWCRSPAAASTSSPPRAVGRTRRARLGKKRQLAAQPFAATAVGRAIAADPDADIKIREVLTRHFGVWREAGGDKIFEPLIGKHTACDEPIVRRRDVMANEIAETYPCTRRHDLGGDRECLSRLRARRGSTALRGSRRGIRDAPGSICAMSTEAPSQDATRFLRLVNSLDHAIVWEFDDSIQQYTFVSDHARLVLGYDADAWKADPHRFERCIVPEDLPGFLALIAKLRDGEANDLRIEHRCVTADGGTRWLHTGVHRAHEHGHLVLRGVSIDINNVKEAEERERAARGEAEHAIRNLEAILAIVSHDVRTPLNNVLVGVELLKRGAPDSEKVLASIGRAAHRLSGLIDDLIDVASIQSQRLRIELTETTTDLLIADALTSFAAVAGEKGVRLTAAPVPKTVLRCDPKRIAQLLANLVGNAVKFTPAGGAVDIAVSVDALEVTFRVVDTGIGIALADQAQVFHRHWQAPETAAQGQGLGLFIAKGIVDAHAGRIWIDSELGRGTTISFTLPVPQP
jgi:PAS domain S-box-containing protein